MSPNVAVRGNAKCPAPDQEMHVMNVRPQIVEALREVRRSLLATSEDVGTRFPEEARKIYYGEVEARSIRGTASSDEVRTLLDEGVNIIAVSPLPEDAN